MHKKEGMFIFTANQTGLYKFTFTNSKWLEGKEVTFALHSGNSSAKLLTGHHFTKIEKRLINLEKKFKGVVVETKFGYKRQETHYETIEGTHNKLFFFTLIESLGILAATFWQIYYIKSLMDDRRLV